MGALWQVREKLKAPPPSGQGADLGRDIANSLFLGWMNGFDTREILSVILYQWLVLDDDDGIVGNGTPNFNAINEGFQVHGFPPFQIPIPRHLCYPPI